MSGCRAWVRWAISSGVLLGAMTSMGCDEDKPAPAAAPTSSAKPAAKGSASAAPAEKPKPWYVGSWQGTYDAQHYLIEMDKKHGGVRDWAEDEGGVGTGEGKLSLTIDEDGVITGSADGPLGKHVATGEVDEKKFRVRLVPEKPGVDAFTGYFLVEQKGDKVEGSLQASSGDSLKVRDAPVTLAKNKTPG